jgi:hypothetical protein
MHFWEVFFSTEHSKSSLSVMVVGVVQSADAR